MYTSVSFFRTSGIRGFSAVEVLVVVAILTVLAFTALIHFKSSKQEAELRSATDTLVLHLEEARSAAIAGKHGETQGVLLDAHGYTLFSGTSYDASDSTNVHYDIDDSLSIENTFESDTVLFSRLSGAVSATGTITITVTADPSASRVITIGSRGDVSVSTP